MLAASTLTKSSSSLNFSGRLGACSTDSVWFLISSSMTAARIPPLIFSVHLQIDRRVRSKGVLEAIISRILFCAKEISSLRFLSLMSVMLTRISLRSSSGKRLKRTSQGISLPSASLCIHSKMGCSPFNARSIYPRRMPNDGVPSGCIFGLMASGPTLNKRLRARLNNWQAFSFASVKRLLSTSNTTIASGAFSTRAR